jgi:hypothetical protein
VAAVDKLDKPTLISKDASLSTRNRMSLSWTGVTAGTTPGGDILGYILKIKDCMTGEEWTAFDGVELGNPNLR